MCLKLFSFFDQSFFPSFFLKKKNLFTSVLYLVFLLSKALTNQMFKFLLYSLTCIYHINFSSQGNFVLDFYFKREKISKSLSVVWVYCLYILWIKSKVETIFLSPRTMKSKIYCHKWKKKQTRNQEVKILNFISNLFNFLKLRRNLIPSYKIYDKSNFKKLNYEGFLGI